MRLPRDCYRIEQTLADHLPTLSPAQRRGLTWWVYGAVLADSACQDAVVTALLPVVGVAAEPALRQALREWGYDGADKAAPCHAQVEVDACFPELLGWVVAWWQDTTLALALDATYLADRVVVLAGSVLSRGGAIPVAWHVLPANQPGAWRAPIQGLLTALVPAVPTAWTVVVLADRGRWSGQIWDALRAQGWHPVRRLRQEATLRPVGGRRQPARGLVPGPGGAWVGAGTAFKHPGVRRTGPLLVVWDAAAAAPWVLLTDLDPTLVGVGWYEMRAWIELGFRALKGVGWHWERTRRTDPARVARHWLVLAGATLWAMATGTRVEDAVARGVAPANLRTAPADAVIPGPRQRSLFARGRSWLRWQLLRVRRLWRRLWLAPEPWPSPPPGLIITLADAGGLPLHS